MPFWSIPTHKTHPLTCKKKKKKAQATRKTQESQILWGVAQYSFNSRNQNDRKSHMGDWRVEGGTSFYSLVPTVFLAAASPSSFIVHKNSTVLYLGRKREIFFITSLKFCIYYSQNINPQSWVSEHNIKLQGGFLYIYRFLKIIY